MHATLQPEATLGRLASAEAGMLLDGCGDSMAPQGHAIPPACFATIGGWVRHPLTLRPADLEAYAPQSVAGFEVVCTFDGAHGAPRALRGVSLRDLITTAEPAFNRRTDFKRVAIVAESTEGYRALFSWHELFNTDVGAGIMLVWHCPEAPLPHPTGPFALVSLHDYATGPRFVKRLANVDVVKLW